MKKKIKRKQNKNRNNSVDLRTQMCYVIRQNMEGFLSGLDFFLTLS